MTEPNSFEDIRKKYFIKSKPIKHGGDCWNTLEVSIFKQNPNGGEQIGSYQRNYHDISNTFCPFILKGKEFALYSPNYTCTRIMSLPDCKDIGGEKSSSNGFCPVDFYVPFYRKMIFRDSKDERDMEGLLTGEECFDEPNLAKARLSPIEFCNFGLVAGCVWGDDTSWKVQFLDLSEADKGKIKRYKRFGYIHLPENMHLKDAVNLSLLSPTDPIIGISHTSYWDILKKKKVNY